VLIYPNDFPAFSTPPSPLSIESTDLYNVQEAPGACDVVLYSPDHTTSLAELPPEHIVKLIHLWRNRFLELGSRDEVKYVFIFENKGKEIGVTMPHPHGQIYAFPYIPPRIERELESAQEHFEKTQRCLFCDIITREAEDGRRIVFQNNSFLAVVPFYARYPYEVHLLPERHFGNISEMNEQEINDLALMLKTILLKYDNLFHFSFPYIMVMHQSPTDGGEYHYYHYHIEFYPPYRSKDKLKYIAGCEFGAGTFLNDTLPEEKAKELREVEFPKF